MTTSAEHAALEEQISHWREYLRRRPAISARDVEELEGHLRDQVAELAAAGLTLDEAFLVAVKRMGSLNALSLEFAREHSERLWKQLVSSSAAGDDSGRSTRAEVLVVLGLAAAAALIVKLPALLGFNLNEIFYARNASLFVLPLLAGYFAWKRGLRVSTWVPLALVFVAAAVVANVYPYPDAPNSQTQTQTLAAIHLPLTLWFIVGVAYVGGRWFAGGGRMDFVRFSGEFFIYYVLIALGGVVLIAFTMMMFKAIGIRADWLAQGWLVPCGAAGAVMIGSWLVEAKKSVIENMAPVLTRVFTPLLAAVLLVFLVTVIWTGRSIGAEREVLISFDLLLALVVGLVLYAVSARDPDAPPDLFDALQLLLVVVALVVDALALVAITSRISEFGFSPNKVAALGENLILLGNLVGSAWLQIRFLRKRGSFAALERWQVAYLPVYPAWATIVVVAFPPLFGFR